MIGKIKGTLVEIDGNHGLIETASGVTYSAMLPPVLLAISTPHEIDIYTHLQIRDDAHVLFGFESKAQRDMFRLLIGVSGVGPKTGFGIIAFAKIDEIIHAIRGNDHGYFSKVPGLGKKTAQKIILELSSKMDSEFEMKNMYLTAEDKTVIDALVSLGFKAHESREILEKLPKDLTLEQKIKEGIRLGSAS
jgi:holliday junction DNA helicase RuvA